MVCDFFDRMYSLDGKGKEKVFNIGKEEMLGKISTFKMFKDILDGLRSM